MLKMLFNETLLNRFCKYVYLTSCFFICWMCVTFPFYFDYLFLAFFVPIIGILQHDDDDVIIGF